MLFYLLTIIIGSLDIPDPTRPGYMRVRFPLSQCSYASLFLLFLFYLFLFSIGLAGKADYVVFATDYDNYGAIYSCQSILFGHRRSASILSRTQTLSPMYITKVISHTSILLQLLSYNFLTSSLGSHQA